MKKKMPRVWASGSFNWNLTQFPASYGGKKIQILAGATIFRTVFHAE